MSFYFGQKSCSGGKLCMLDGRILLTFIVNLSSTVISNVYEEVSRNVVERM